MPRRATAPPQEPLPVAAVNKPIICGPYDEPDQHWRYDADRVEWVKEAFRRPASYYYKSQRIATAQLGLPGLAEEEREDLALVNRLRDDVRRWRGLNYEGATPITRQLLTHWASEDRPRRLFFCQREAVETVIYLAEILESGRRTRWTPSLSQEDFQRLRRGSRPSFIPAEVEDDQKWPRLIDQPHEGGKPLRRYGCKMATGSGKTVVMSMLIAWALCNRGRAPSDERFPGAVLVVCPNLTIKERLQVLRTDRDDNYYTAFDIVPSTLMPELKKGRVLVTNWHRFAPESPHAEAGRSYNVVNKGPESADAFARRVLGDLYDRAPILVLNDEAHHAYRPAAVGENERMTAAEKAEREEATVWIAGLDRINQACGVRLTVDLSATPFYLHGSGYIEGSPFPWIVSDFGLVDAIESGIVKIPRLPVSDTTGRPDPKFFRLWQHIVNNLQPGERLPGGRPKPDVTWREAQDALVTLASQWKERFEYAQEATPGQEHAPPVLIVVCDNTDIADAFFRGISGEQVEEVIDAADLDDDSEDEGDDEATARPKRSKRGGKKTRTVYGTGRVFPALLSNRPGERYTMRIDSKLLAEAESDDPGTNRSAAAEQLREVLATVGRPGQPGEKVRCVVAVQMLNEGWDANNVTNILGLRAFGSQLLCEQVVGRGLRRMDYTVDKETGLLTEEYVDVYGVPFSIIPMKGRQTKAAAPEDRPKNHVFALDERKSYEIRFPVVEGYAFALRRNLIKADIDSMQPLVLEPDRSPTATFVQPQVGYHQGTPRLDGGFEATLQDREEFYRSHHPQTIAFEITRRVVWNLTQGVDGRQPKLRLQARNQLFPQVHRLVDAYIRKKVILNGCNPSELGLDTYVDRAVGLLVMAIEPNDESGEPPLLPILNRYKPIGSTAQVDFKTTRPCHGTIRSHLNQVVLDTQRWERSAAFVLDASKTLVTCYARTDGMEFVIPYEYQGVSHSYRPDFLVRLTSGVTLILELKGQEDNQDRAKHEAAERWVKAVNHWGELGPWDFHVCRNPAMLARELDWLIQRAAT